MAIDEHADEFAGLPVRDYQPGEPIGDPAGAAHRLNVEYDEGEEEGVTMVGRLAEFLDDPASRRVKAIVIGPWESVYDSGNTSAPIVEALAGARDRLPDLRAIFLGDILSEESEISWIAQSDVGPLLAAYPKLETLRVRGGTGLEFSCDRHGALRTLVIESGGLPAEVVRRVAAADFPALEHLELWLGDEGYGGDSTVEDLAPILDGTRFPKLKYLGFCDCSYADDLAAALAGAPILGRIETLDLSLGTLGDEGAVALLEGGHLGRLKKLDIHHHYVSDEVLDGLKALGIELDDDDQQSEDDGYGGGRYVAVSE